MPTFSLTLNFRSDGASSNQEKPSQKIYWQGIADELRKEGARILNVQSTVGKVGKTSTPVNVITITYEAPAQIKYEGQQSHRDGGNK